MATPNLTNWTCGLQTGESYKLEVLVAGSWWKVGTASASELSSSEVSFKGSYDRFGYHGSFDLSLKVTGDNTGSFSVNGKTRPCTFTEAGKYLYVHFNEGGRNVTLDVECWEHGIWFGGDAVPGGHHIWIGK